jgi:TRAP-type mannitol/chloroaromatic compound transport system substrate-binding protein
MKRRTFLASAGTAAAASTFPAPAVSQGIRELKLVSAYPKVPRTELLARTITEVSGGRLRVKLFNAGELVGPFEVFDAVSEGLADMYVANEYYWQDRSPGFSFFTTVPFGLTAVEMYAWIYWGGGQKLWDELSAKFNLKPFPSDVGEVQMGGWYNKEMASIESFRDLRIRMPGLGGELMRRLGAIVINLPAGEIVPALKSGALDAAEWVGPDLDLRLGLPTAAKYYYYPGIHEPGNVQSFAINKGIWDSLSDNEQKLIETTLAGGPINGLVRRHVEQMKVLPILLEKHEVELRKFDDEILRTFGKVSGEVVAEVGASDPLTKRIYESYMKFRKTSRRWTDISERAYLNARELDFPYGT